MRTPAFPALAVAVALLLAVAIVPAAGAANVTVAGVSLSDQYPLDGAPLVLNGAGVRSKLFIKVYVGALYLPAKQADAAALLAADAPRRMALHFVRKVTAQQLCDSWKEGLAANTPNAGPEVVAGFDQLCAAMKDVEEGSVLSLTYRPGTGTEIALGGKRETTIPGKPFADAVLACWIGPEPGPGEDFKQAVLGA
jgi:hypothetical protein